MSRFENRRLYRFDCTFRLKNDCNKEDNLDNKALVRLSWWLVPSTNNNPLAALHWPGAEEWPLCSTYWERLQGPVPNQCELISLKNKRARSNHDSLAIDTPMIWTQCLVLMLLCSQTRSCEERSIVQTRSWEYFITARTFAHQCKVIVQSVMTPVVLLYFPSYSYYTMRLGSAFTFKS